MFACGGDACVEDDSHDGMMGIPMALNRVLQVLRSGIPRPTEVHRRRALTLLTLLCLSCTLPPSTRHFPSGIDVYQIADVGIADGVPTAADLALASSLGYQTVFDLREKSEIRDHPLAAAQKTGLRYYHLPVRVSAIEKTLLARFQMMLAQAPRPVLLHCTHGQRAAAFWAMDAIASEELSVEEALVRAAAAGLSHRQLIQKVRGIGE